MKNVITIAAMFLIFSVSASAQDAKQKSTARPSEQREIAADNHLKRSIQQKQLSLPAEKIADTTQTIKVDEKKKKKCGTKSPGKA